MKVPGRTVPSRWQCSSTFGIRRRNCSILFAVFLRRSRERLVVLLALRRRGEDRRGRGDRLVEEALLLRRRQMNFLAAVLRPDLLRALDVLGRPAERVLVRLSCFLAYDALKIWSERLHEVAVDERHGRRPVRRQIGHGLGDVVELERGEERGAG